MYSPNFGKAVDYVRQAHRHIHFFENKILGFILAVLRKEISKENLKLATGMFNLISDLYQITMAYAYWKSGKTEDNAVFDLFFRANPFQGEFTVFAGLEEVLKFLENFRYSDSGELIIFVLVFVLNFETLIFFFSDIDYLKDALKDHHMENDFYDFLKSVTAATVTVHAIDEGSIVFPRVPLLRLEGPLIIVQLLETTLLTLVNYAR